MFNIALCGCPGSGRGSQGLALAEYFGLEYAAAGRMLGEENRNDTPGGRAATGLYECGRLVQAGLLEPSRSGGGTPASEVEWTFMPFELASSYEPRGDQGRAIEQLVRSLRAGNRHQTLLGVTGSGKTFTVANVVRDLDRPTLVMSHNKTLAAQLYSEFKQFFPGNAVEYFVSYFDYYQPEAYIPRTDTFIEKDSSINEEIERLRLSAVSSLLSRRDTLVVASVSCIYGLASPEDFLQMLATVKQGQQMSREALLGKLVDMLYERNDIAFGRGKFRVRGDVVEVHQAQIEDEALRIEFFGDEIERISRFDPLTGHPRETLSTATIFPAKQFVTPHDKLRRAAAAIRAEMEERVAFFERDEKWIEAQRIKQRTEFDLEMMQEMGFCSGIENYSRHLSGRPPGSRPYTLMDFLPEDFLLVVDESHATVPQIGAMYAGDRSRKSVLVDYGFRLPSALDNRPLNFAEFMGMTRQILYASATPGGFELRNSVVGNADFLPVRAKESKDPPAPVPAPGATFDPLTPGSPLIIEQIIRPTGLLDPKITLRPLRGQIDETIERCRQRIEKGERVLVTTLTKRTAEDLADYLRDVGLRVRYLHSDIDTIERVEILRGLRAGDCDVLVGINLLREGLDLPEVSLVCILDADKEGYLRSRTSLIQTAGRAARHINGEVVLFTDTVTSSIQALIDVSEYRRARQIAHNEEHGITPRSVRRAVQESLHVILKSDRSLKLNETPDDLGGLLSELETDMVRAASNLEYERAALLRDQIAELKTALETGKPAGADGASGRRGAGRRRNKG
jgi:excinuclease ABC subunit B